MIEKYHDAVCYLQFNHYQQFTDLIHGVFTRSGGYSSAPYHSLNTATHPRGGGDSIDNVIRNRVLALQALGVAHLPCVTLWQFHGATVVPFSSQDDWRSDWASHSYYVPGWSPQSIRKGDALITNERDVTLALSFADCVPIIFYDPERHVIGITHAGWRGTARGIALATVEAMATHFACQPAHIYAGIAPAIGPCCYEVSETVQHLFTGAEHFDDQPTEPRYHSIIRETATFTTQELPDRVSLRLNLQETNRQQLLMAGLHPDHIEVMPICTSCHTDRFFSHRPENGKTGRFVVLIGLQTSRAPA